MPLLKTKLMEEVKIRREGNIMNFKTRFDQQKLNKLALFYQRNIVMFQNAKFVEGVSGVSVVGPPKREEIQQQVQYILKWDQ